MAGMMVKIINSLYVCLLKNSKENTAILAGAAGSLFKV
jgi:hypothetical protein